MNNSDRRYLKMLVRQSLAQKAPREYAPVDDILDKLLAGMQAVLPSIEKAQQDVKALLKQANVEIKRLHPKKRDDTRVSDVANRIYNTEKDLRSLITWIGITIRETKQQYD